MHQLSTDEFKEVRDKAAEQLLSYIFTQNSSHEPLKKSLQNGYAKGVEQFPDTRVDALRTLNNFSQPTKQPTSYASEGTSFGQVGESSGVYFDPDYWGPKTCYGCGKKGHPIWSHTKEEQEQFAKEKKSQGKGKKKPNSDGGSDDESDTPKEKSSKKSSKKKSPAKKAGSKKVATIKEAANMFVAHVTEFLESEDQAEEEDDGYDSH